MSVSAPSCSMSSKARVKEASIADLSCSICGGVGGEIMGDM